MNKTLVVVGAGASKDFCKVFPTGAELFKEINYYFLTEQKEPPVRKAQGRFLSAMMNEIHRVFPEVGDQLLVKVKNQIWNLQLAYDHGLMRDNTDIMAPSVDRFISESISEGRLDLKAMELMKYAIAYLIKGAETAVVESARGDTDNWIKHLLDGLGKLDIREVNGKVRVVTFNYDRTVERSIEKYANGTGLEVEKVLSHVYGSLGELSEFPFERNNNATTLMKSAYRSIRLIGEERRATNYNHSNFTQVHFLGFGYDEKNMNLLALPPKEQSRMRGTGRDMSDAQVKALREKRGIEIETRMSCIEYVDSMLLPNL